MHLFSMLQSLALLTVANTTPLIAKRILGDRCDRPIDNGLAFLDGRPLFGRSKTIRGLALSVLMTSATALLIGVELKIGFLVGLLAMIGDLFSSFLKRRLNVPPSGRAFGLDQVPESLLPLLVCRRPLLLTGWEIAIVSVVFFVGEVLLSRLFYRLHLRDRPY
jgi:CDP-2,3-bis-(O-geranylgeranyl)-sn-glycerol synthase